jgi:hypothetical protein
MVPSPFLGGFRRLCFASLFLVLPLIGGAGPGRAQEAGANDVYTVEGVAVDATAQTAATARDNALARGQAEAFRRLLSRLTTRADAERLPRPSAAAIADMVLGLEVENEKTSAVRYIADLRVRFRADSVRNLLRQNGIPFAETRSKPVLVLPVLATDAGPVLWEQTTPWREAWAAVPRDEGLVPLVVPVGDLDDLHAITAQTAVSGDTARLNAIARHYNAGDAVVAIATPHYSGETVTTVQVSINRFSALGQDQTVVESYSPSGDKDAWAVAAAGVAGNIEESWKRSALIRYDSAHSLTAVVALAGIDELVDIRRRLAGIAILRQADLVYLARNEAQFRFDYFGDERQLITAFAQHDLILEQGGTGWRFRPRVAPGSATGRLGTLPEAGAPGAADAPPAVESLPPPPDGTVIVQ